MPEYEFVPKKEYQPVKAGLEEILREVIAVMQEKYATDGIRFQLIGSGSRHLVTRIKGGNKGFDLDYNIILPTLQEGWSYNPGVLANQFTDAFRQACAGTSYKFPRLRTSVFQLKNVDRAHSSVCFGGDFAVIYYDADSADGYRYLKHWDDGHFTFEQRAQSRNVGWKLEEILEYNSEQGWNRVREEYLKLKNRNPVPEKRSSVLYQEAVHNVYNQIMQEKAAEDEQNRAYSNILNPAGPSHSCDHGSLLRPARFFSELLR